MLASVKVTSYTTWGLWRNSFHCEWSRKGMSSTHISDVRDCETEWVWCVTDDHMRAQARQVPRSFIAHSSGSSRHYGNPPILSGQNWSEGKGQKENRIKKKIIKRGKKKNDATFRLPDEGHGVHLTGTSAKGAEKCVCVCVCLKLHHSTDSCSRRRLNEILGSSRKQ